MGIEKSFLDENLSYLCQCAGKNVDKSFTQKEWVKTTQKQAYLSLKSLKNAAMGAVPSPSLYEEKNYRMQEGGFKPRTLK